MNKKGFLFASGFIATLVVYTMSACTETSLTSQTSPLWNNLDLILTRGGLPAVILLFGYLYLRSIQQATARQIKSMQEQIAAQQSVMISALENNTKALSKLGTAMLMGCPLIRNQLLQGEIDDEGRRQKEDGRCAPSSDKGG